MELKESAVVVILSSLLVLLLGIAIGGLIFYAAFLIALSILIVDYFVLRFLADDLKKNLLVTRELSRNELYIGMQALITSTLSYKGKAKLKALIVQSINAPIGEDNRWCVELKASSQTRLEMSLKPTISGDFTIMPLAVTFESWLFKDSLKVGKELKITVYLPVGYSLKMSSMSGSRAVKSFNIFNTTFIKKGKGSDFSSMKKYEPGDNSKDIDWARSSRLGGLFVKEFEDEYYRPMYFILDIDRSMVADGQRSGLNSALDLTTFLINRTLINNERVGIACFSGDDVTLYNRLGSGREHVNGLKKILSNLRPFTGDNKHPGRINSMITPMDIQHMLKGEAGLSTIAPIIEATFHEYVVNVKADGFAKAITMASQSSDTPCHFIVMTGLSMGLISLLNGIRIAKYYGHQISVVLVPHTWHEENTLVGMETKDIMSKLGRYGVSSIVMYPGERPEDVVHSGSVTSLRANIRR
jgi:uncharacterized protein (DUF58 family)